MQGVREMGQGNEKDGSMDFSSLPSWEKPVFSYALYFAIRGYLISSRLVGGTVSTFFGMVSVRMPSL